MADDHWFEEFASTQDSSPLKPRERQEVRARAMLDRIKWLKRRRTTYWARMFLLAFSVATVLSQVPAAWIVRKISAALSGGGS
jgi:hypothetical protein